MADPLAECRALLADATAALQATIPADRAAAILALLRATGPDPPGWPPPAPRPGWNHALRLCLDAPDLPAKGASPADSWAEAFLATCDDLARAGRALERCAASSLQLQRRDARTFVAWGSGNRLTVEARERADFDWWTAHLAKDAQPPLAALLAARHPASQHPRGYVVSGPEPDGYFQRLGRAHLPFFANQHSYPPDARIGGATVGEYAEVLALLIGLLYQERARQPDPAPVVADDAAIVAALAAALAADPGRIATTLQPFVLDRHNVAYHSAPLGGAAPPLIRLDDRRLALSATGLLGTPLIFLMRELRRRHAQEYHNSAAAREAVFRRDLHALCADRRFVASPGRVELKRRGEARTDLDALIFDRKSGTLALFELKAQDPFARTAEERTRQRDAFLAANRQVGAALEWVQRHGADDLLARFDERAGKSLRVQKVLPFVLGRYLAHFADRPAPDRRAAWGSWPEVLRLTGGKPFGPDERNPLAALFARLRDAAPPDDAPAAEVIAAGDLRLVIYPTYAALRAAEGGPPAP